MELCQKCPMKDERYVPTDVVMKREISGLKMTIESTRDFITWLFDESEHCDHITYQDAWDEFQAWDEKQNRYQNVQEGDTTEAK